MTAYTLLEDGNLPDAAASPSVNLVPMCLMSWPSAIVTVLSTSMEG